MLNHISTWFSQDEYVGVKGARIVLCDTEDGVRATMTAHWLIQLGHDDVVVLAEAPAEPEVGPVDEMPPLFMPAETLTPDEMQAVQDSGEPVAVIDLSDSLTFRKGHVPGARWAIRARFKEALRGLFDVGMVMLTAPDERLAHYAAHDLKTLRPDLVVRVLKGGTAAWTASGRPLEAGIEGNTLNAIDDVWWKPYDNKQQVRQAMEDYLTWEVGLVEQVERDGLVQFRKFD